MTNKMEKKISRRQAFYIALSILMAVSIWIFVDVSDARQATVVARDIPIEYVGVDDILVKRGLMLIDEGTDQTVDLELSGRRWDIALLDKSQIRIQADLKDITSVGKQNISYRIIYPDRSFNNLIKVTDASSMTAEINVGELYSRMIEVRCEIQGKIADGYTAGKLDLSPGELEIRGREELIDQISYAKVTLNLDDAASTVSQLLDYEFYDTSDRLVKKTGVHAAEDQVQVTLPVNVTKELKLTMDFLESPGARMKNVKYTIEPASITVSGDAEKLKDIDSIVLDRFNLLSMGTTTAQQHHTYGITVPEGCENLSGVTRATLDIGFRDMDTTSVTVTNFRCENLPTGKTVDVLTQELDVKLFGPESALRELSAKDLIVHVDLADLSSASGTYTIPADISIVGTNSVGAAGTYQVRVTIREDQNDFPNINHDETPSEE